MLNLEWETISEKYIGLKNFSDCLVRTIPSPDGRFMWQFRKVVSWADTVEEAKAFVEAGMEYFKVMKRNPYKP